MAAETQYYDFNKIKNETGGDQEQRYYDFSGTFDKTIGTTSYKKPETDLTAKSDPNEMAKKTTDITRRNQARDSGLVLTEIPAAQPVTPAVVRPAVQPAQDVNTMARNTTDISLRNKQRDAQAAAYQEQRNARNAQTDEEKEAAGQRAIAAEESAYQLGKKIEANREASGGSVYEPPKPGKKILNRFVNTNVGGLLGSVASTSEAARTLYEAGQGGRTQRDAEMLSDVGRQLETAKQQLEAAREQNRKIPGSWDETSFQNTVDTLQRQYDALYKVVNENVQQRAAAAVSDMNDSVQAQSQQRIEAAKEGLGGFGQLLVDAGASTAQMAADRAASAALGGGLMLPLAVRSFGGAAQEARQGGGSLAQQIAYAVPSVAVEIFTERMSNIASPFKAAYGGGNLGIEEKVDEIIASAVKKFAKNGIGEKLLGGALKGFASFAFEGLEEFVGDWLSWQLPRIYKGDVNSFSDQLADSLLDFVTGGLSGLFGSAVDVGTYTYNADAEISRMVEERAQAAEYRNNISLGKNLKAAGITNEQVRSIIANVIGGEENEGYFDALSKRIAQGEDLSQMGDAELGALYSLYTAMNGSRISEEEYQDRVQKIVDSRELEAMGYRWEELAPAFDPEPAPDAPQLPTEAPVAEEAPSILPPETPVQEAETPTEAPVMRDPETAKNPVVMPENLTSQTADAGMTENLTLPEMPDAPVLTETDENGTLTEEAVPGEPKYSTGNYVIDDSGKIWRVTGSVRGANGRYGYNLLSVDGESLEGFSFEDNISDFNSAKSEIDGYLDTIENKSQKTKARKYLYNQKNYKSLKALSENPDVRMEVYTREGNGLNFTEYRAYGAFSDDPDAFKTLSKIEYGFYNYLKNQRFSDEDTPEITDEEWAALTTPPKKENPILPSVEKTQEEEPALKLPTVEEPLEAPSVKSRSIDSLRDALKRGGAYNTLFNNGPYSYNVRYDNGAKVYTGSVEEYNPNSKRFKNKRVFTTDEFSERDGAIEALVDWARNHESWDAEATGSTESIAAESAPEISELPDEPEMVLPTEDTPQRKPHEALSDALLTKLKAGEAITREELQNLAADAYGGSRGSGNFDMKTAYDALELAVNRYLMTADFVKKGNGNAANARMTEKRMLGILDLLPTQNVRTEEQVQYQQFSTPPNIAYLAAWAANIDKTDTILEPSAGIGGLALWGKAWGATVYGNELSQRRAEILRSLGLDEVFTENAEQINNILPDYVSPSVVLMNPPFSSAAGRTSTNNTANAKRHVEQALERLQDGGRLVTILGRGMSNDSKTFAPWWDELRKDYNIRANLSINGENYKKYGTDFDVQLVVIDKTGPQEDRSTTITGQVDDLLTVPGILEGVRNDRQRIEADDNQPVRRDLQPGNQPRPDSVVGQSGAGRGSERTEGGSLTPSAGTGMERSGNGGRGNQPGRTRADELGVGDGGRGRVRREGGGDAGSDSGKRESERDDRPVPQLTLGGLNEAEEAPAKPKEDNGVYAEYVPPKTGIQGAQKHPAKLVESAAMASVPAPKVDYTPNLPQELITSGKLSDVQLTNIVYAGAAHSQMIPEQNTRKGYFIGDGTGVGKGRQIAGIILDNFRQGREKAVWISNGYNLFPDAQRDWSAIGGDKKQVFSLDKAKLSDKIKAGKGIMFTTYSTLASKSPATKRSRINQLVEWLGEDFDGVIAFDEAHNMGNLLGKKGTFGGGDPSQMALAGAELQKRLPNARVVYVSATMATDVDGMAFADRLGLWGPGTQFTNVRDFVDKIGSGGLAAMELVARDMKAMGVYQARSISFDGVQYETLTHNLTNTQTQIYDTMSRAWQITFQNINDALRLTGANLNPNAKKAAKSAYYNAMQRFYRQIITSMSMPSVISDIRKRLDEGKSVVLQIVNTNEAATKRAITEMEDSDSTLEDLDITPRETLIGYLMKSFPVQEYEIYEDDNGRKQSRPVVDSAGNPVLNKKSVAERDRLIEQINSMSVPQGPLDLLFDAFGVENVAEVTGRKQRVVPGRDKDGNLTKVLEKRNKNSSEADAQAFQDGKKRILVFSNAGGTGKSYHADLTANNQQQRVHYILQTDWNAPKVIQGLGRTNRSNQASAPIYVLVTTNASGQKRFVSTIARRLDQLGAITKGQRQTGSGVFSAKDNLESDLARSSLVNFYRYLLAGQLPGLDATDVIESLGLSDSIKGKDGKGDLNMSVASSMETFLNRIMSLELDKQNAVFDAFNTIFEREYEKALEDGTLDMGMETVRADKVEVADEITVYTDPKTGAETKYVQAKAYTKTNPARTVEALKKRAKNFIGLYRKNDGTVIGVFSAADRTDESGAVTKQVKVLGPVSSGTWQLKTLEKQAAPIPESEWDDAWAAEVEKAPKYKEEVKHMLTGALLPVWNKLPVSGNVKVQRLIADDGRQYLGRIIDPVNIDGVLKSLGATKGRTKKTYSPSDVQKAVFQNGGKAILENDRMTLTRRLVGGEQRIEISGDNLWAIRDRIPEIYTEIIQSKTRYFIPNGEKQLRTLEKLLKMNPVREVQEAKAASYSKGIRNMNGNELPPDPEAWTAERVGSREAKAMSLPDLVEKLRHEYKIPVNTGGLRAPDARAAYLTKPRSVRMKVTGDIADLSHELGHHLDNLYGISDGVTDEAMQEAISKLSDEFKAAYEDDELPGEAVSEFLRRYFLNSETAKIDYPAFYDEFFRFFGKSEKAKLAEIADEFNAYYALSEEQENFPIHNAEYKGTDFRSFSEKASDLNERFRMKFLDLTEPLRRVDKETGGKSHIYAINSDYANERARAALTGDLYDLHANPIGEGLQKILKGVDLNNEKEYSALGMWLVCKHGIEVLADGHRVFANDAWNNPVYMESTMAAIEAKYPKIDFEDISERLYTFQKNVMEAYGVGGGLYSQETVDGWNEKWQFYVPFYRWFNHNDKPGKGQKRGYVNQTGHVRRLVGSGRDFINPVDNIMESTVRLITTAVYNDVARHAFDEISRVDGLGYLAEKWPEPVKKTTMNVTAEKGAFLSDLEARGLVDQDTYDEIASILNNQIGDVLEQYSRGKASGDTVTVMRNGKPETWKINDPDLLRALTNLTPNRRESILNAIGSVNRFITGNITGRNVIWAITSNSVRDLGTAITIGGPKIIPKLISGIVENWANSFKGDSANPLFKEYMAMGGESASAFTADRQMQKKIRNELQHTKWHYLNPITYMSFVGDTVERGPRYAYYKICRAEYGMTPEEAFYAAGEITTNFHRKGLYSSELNALIPFSNASLQSMDRESRWIQAEEVTDPKKRKKTAKGRILAYLGASFAIAVLETLLNNSNDRKRKYYRYLSSFTKNSYFVIPLPGGKVLAIPKARELMIPISFFERLIERTVLGNKEAFDGFWEYVTDNTLPGVISGIAQGDWNSVVGDLAIIGDIHYLVSNQDFLGRPIVSASLENLNPEDQYNNSTSVPAKIVGEMFKVSPQMVDYIGSNYFTFAWKPMKALWNVGGTPDYTLGVRSQWEKDPLYSTDFINNLYDARDKAKQDKNSNPGSPDKAMKWKLLDSMTTAYSRYYALAKAQPEDAQSRALRESVLDAVEGALNGENPDPAFRYVKDAVAAADSPGDVMPSAVAQTVKYETKTINLTASEYWNYQTDYNAKFYNYVRQAMKANHTPEEKVNVCKAAKDVASIMAKGAVIEAHGGTSDDYDELLDFIDGGGEVSDFIRYKAAKNAVDDDGYNSSEAIGVVAGLQLPDVYSQAYMLSQQSESLGQRFKQASGYGVDIDEFALVMDGWEDKQQEWKASGQDGKSGWTQKAAEEAIDAIYGKTTVQNRSEKAAAWQALNGQWSPKNNPYSQDVGNSIYSALQLPTE